MVCCSTKFQTARLLFPRSLPKDLPCHVLSNQVSSKDVPGFLRSFQLCDHFHLLVVILYDGQVKVSRCICLYWTKFLK